MVARDRRWVSFMRSYPNFIPLNAEQVRQIVSALEPYAFDRIYGGWFEQNIASDGSSVLRRSAERYLRAIGAATWSA